MESVLAGNRVEVETVVVVATTPSPDPTANVYVNTAAGVQIAVLTETVNVSGTTVTVTASWDIPDALAGGVYIITTDIAGTVIAADQRAVRVIRRTAPTVV